MWPKRMEGLAAFSAREVAAEERDEQQRKETSLCRGTVRIEVEGKIIPASFLKVEGRGTLVGAKDRGERDR